MGCAPTSAPRCSPVPRGCSSWRTTSRSCPRCAAAARRRSSTAAPWAAASSSRARRSRSTVPRRRTCRCAGPASCRERNAPAPPCWGDTGACRGVGGWEPSEKLSGAQGTVLADLRVAARAGAVRGPRGQGRGVGRGVGALIVRAAEPLLGGVRSAGHGLLGVRGDLGSLLLDGRGGVLRDLRRGLLGLGGAALHL